MKKALSTILLLVCLSLIGQNPRWVIFPNYDAVADFSDGIAAVKLNEKWGYINEKGNSVAPCQYEQAYPFNDGWAVLAGADNRLTAIINREGTIIAVNERLNIDPRFPLFNNGLLLVSDGRKWGYLDTTGKLSISCKYLFALPFSEGLAGVRYDYNGAWYYIAPDGSTAIQPGFQGNKREVYWAMGFNKDKALVVFNNGLGFIDRSGNILDDEIPRFLPPADALDYKKNVLKGKNGELFFNTQACADSMITRKGEIIHFNSTQEFNRNDAPFYIYGTLANKQAKWISEKAVVVKTDEKYGVIMFEDIAPLQISVRESELKSVFGCVENLQLDLQNHTDFDLYIRLTSDENILSEKLFIPKNEKSTFAVGVTKTNDERNELQTLNLMAEDSYGLRLNSQELNFTIIDVPSVAILPTAQKIEVNSDAVTYPVKIVVRNLSDVEGKDMDVTVNRQKQKTTIQPKSESTLKFDMPLKEQTIEIAVKPQSAAPVTLSHKMMVVVKPKQIKQNEKEKIHSDTEDESSKAQKDRNLKKLEETKR